jgi:hypothetical protein
MSTLLLGPEELGIVCLVADDDGMMRLLFGLHPLSPFLLQALGLQILSRALDIGLLRDLGSRPSKSDKG